MAAENKLDRDRGEAAASDPKGGAAGPEQKFEKPIIPLLWILIPLIACIVYGIVTMD